VELHPAVRAALAVLSEEGGNEKLPELAHRCGVSAAYLSRVFKKQIGVPLSRYRNSLRLSRFWDCCRPSEKTLLAAIHEAGFGSYAQFYKVFRQAYSQGPRDWLRERN
jgi:transcriptional regulator GlxA family with amidase domain